MKKGKIQSILCLLTVLALIAGLTACGKAEPVEGDSGPESPAEIDLENLVFLNPLAPPDGSAPRTDIPDLLPKVMSANEENEHTVGWLQLPNTSLDDVVVQHPDDTSNSNAFYLRRGFDKKYLFAGTYFVDYRSNVSEGRDKFAKNTIIYGHSMNDDVDGDLFNPLKLYRENEEFARNNPYIYFATEDETLVWEVFAAFDTKWEFHYNQADPPADEFAEIISEAQRRSYFLYDDVSVSASDKILTLSTCTYNYVASYPNDYRYVVMAKLVPEGEKLKATATLTENESRKLP